MSFCNLCNKQFKKAGYAISDRHTKSKAHLKAIEKNEVKVAFEPIQEEQPQLINLISEKNTDLDIKDTGSKVSTINEIETKMTEIEVEEPVYKVDNIFPENKINNSQEAKPPVVRPRFSRVSNPNDYDESLLSNELPEGQFRVQKPMFDYMEEHKHSIPIKITDKIFTSFQSQDEFADAIIDNSNPMYYELLQEGMPQRMFCELDGHLPYNGLSLNEVLMQFNGLMNHIFTTLNIGASPRNITLTSASNSNKLSIHWVNTKYVFQNCDIQKKFWNYVVSVQAELYPDLNLVIKQNTDGEKYQIKSIIDTAVYTKNRAMRTIYSTKEGQQRPLVPIKFCNTQIQPIKRGRVNIMDYLIFQPNATEFCDIKLPIYDKLKSPVITREMIESEILKMVPDVEIADFNPPLIKLRNTGARQCIINGEINESDNCFVEWRRDGLYFGCHDDGCDEKIKISDLGNNRHKAEVKIDMKEPKFTTDDIRREYANRILDANDLHELHNKLIERLNTYYSYIKASKSYVMEEYVNNKKELVVVPKQLSTLKDDWSNKGFNYKITKEVRGKPCVVDEYLDIYAFWRKHRNRTEYDKVELDPQRFLNNTDSNIFNMFNGFDYPDIKQPSNVNPDHPFLKHIREVWCSDNLDQYNYVIDWMAHALQKPWKKIGRCIVLRGSPGCGKGIIVQTFAKLMGKKYMIQPTSSNDVLGSFNSLLMGKLLVFLDEMTWGGDHERAGVVKKLITEESLVINQKNIAKITVNNFANIIMAGNGTYLHHADAEARRFLDLEVNKRFKRNPNKQQIIRDILNCDLRQLANFFYTRDISGFLSRDPPITEFQRTQQIQSLSVYDKWWLNELNNPTDINFGSRLYKQAIYNSFNQSQGSRHTSAVVFWKWMKTRIGSFKNIRLRIGKERAFAINMITLEEAREIWRDDFNDPDWSFDSSIDCNDMEMSDDDDDIACM